MKLIGKPFTNLPSIRNCLRGYRYGCRYRAKHKELFVRLPMWMSLLRQVIGAVCVVIDVDVAIAPSDRNCLRGYRCGCRYRAKCKEEIIVILVDNDCFPVSSHYPFHQYV